jgi:hypothetical protein
MRKSFIRLWGAAVAAACLLTAAPGWAEQKIKITVAGKDAAIHLSPDPGSRVIQSAPFGSVFEAERKTGEWYEVKLPSKLGVTITGYIHEKYVATEQAPAKAPEAPAKIVGESVAPRPEKQPPAKAEISVRFGYSPGAIVSSQSAFTYTWSSGNLQTVAEAGEIGHEFGTSLGAGLAFSYFFAGGIGVQLRYDHMLTAKIDAGNSYSAYAIAWTWTDGTGPFSQAEEWDVTGEYAVSPVSLNVIYKIPSKGMIAPYLSAGMTYFLGNVKVETTRGYGFTWTTGNVQSVDYLDIPLQISDSIGSFGVNAGGGLDVLLAPRIALNIEAVYFGGKTIEKSWKPIAGTYPGNIFPANAWQATQAYLDENANQNAPLKIKTSFIRLFAGVKFSF